MSSIKQLINDPFKLLLSATVRFQKNIPDKWYLMVMFRSSLGYWPNLKHPKTFNEKLQWLKLYDRKPEYTTMVDKYTVKDYVAAIIGEEYIIPTLGVWDKPEDIEWDKLPSQFVLKCTHDSGGLVICRDKDTLDKAKAIDKLSKSLQHDYYLAGREWPYKDVPRRIIAEKYINPSPVGKDLADYKWYCFDGVPQFCQVIQDRNTKETIDFFDTDWNHQEFVGLNPDAGPATITPARPKNLGTQIEIAKKLSKDMPFSRIDLYEIGEKEYFGEITLYPASGFGAFKPDQYNKILGAMLTLPGEKRGGVIAKIRENSEKMNVGGEIEITRPDLLDFKFFCFNGKVYFFKVDFDRFTNHHANYYDTKWNLLPFGEADYLPNPKKKIEKPDGFEKMLEIAHTLAADIPFIRIDLYNLHGKIYFGEMTFYPASGFGVITPAEYDNKIGEMIILKQEY